MSMTRLSWIPSPIFVPAWLYASTSNTTLRPSTSFTFPFTVTCMPMGVGAMCLTSTR